MDFLWDGIVDALHRVASGDGDTYHAVWVSLFCTVVSISLAAVIAVPYGAWLAVFRPRGHRVQVFLLRVGMALPTVVIGLIIYGLLSRRGLFGGLDLLYTKVAIIAGEFILAFPLLGTLAHGTTAALDRRVAETALTLGASRSRTLGKLLGEVRVGLVAIYLAAFGRCITELGIAITVGGNLRLRTRTLPSTIQLEVSRGDFAAALAPGILLIVLACGAAMLTHWLSREARP